MNDWPFVNDGRQQKLQALPPALSLLLTPY